MRDYALQSIVSEDMTDVSLLVVTSHAGDELEKLGVLGAAVARNDRREEREQPAELFIETTQKRRFSVEMWQQLEVARDLGARWRRWVWDAFARNPQQPSSPRLSTTSFSPMRLRRSS